MLFIKVMIVSSHQLCSSGTLFPCNNIAVIFIYLQNTHMHTHNLRLTKSTRIHQQIALNPSYIFLKGAQKVVGESNISYRAKCQHPSNCTGIQLADRCCTTNTLLAEMHLYMKVHSLCMYCIQKTCVCVCLCVCLCVCVCVCVCVYVFESAFSTCTVYRKRMYTFGFQPHL